MHTVTVETFRHNNNYVTNEQVRHWELRRNLSAPETVFKLMDNKAILILYLNAYLDLACRGRIQDFWIWGPYV